jgi:hypothetical protein
MFIINAITTLPVGLLGPFIWPGTPDKLKSFFLSEEEVQQARTRLERAGHAHSSDLSWSKVGAMFMNWKSYPLGHLLLERQLQLLGGRLHPLAQKSGTSSAPHA